MCTFQHNPKYGHAIQLFNDNLWRMDFCPTMRLSIITQSRWSGKAGRGCRFVVGRRLLLHHALFLSGLARHVRTICLHLISLRLCNHARKQWLTRHWWLNAFMHNRNYISTNYDTLFERAMDDQRKNHVVTDSFTFYRFPWFRSWQFHVCSVTLSAFLCVTVFACVVCKSASHVTCLLPHLTDSGYPIRDSASSHSVRYAACVYRYSSFTSCCHPSIQDDMAAQNARMCQPSRGMCVKHSFVWTFGLVFSLVLFM